jgi:hypothetical protein
MVAPQASVGDPASRDILISAGLFVADPSSVEGLQERISMEHGIDPEFQPIPYDTHMTTGEMVRCSVCAHRARHYSGFIVRSGAGELGLVGIECGESRLFGEGGWQQMVNKTVRAQKAALYKQSWGPARRTAELALQALGRWAEASRKVDQQQDKFRESFEELSDRLRTELVDGTLSAHEEVTRTYQAPDGSERQTSQYLPVVVLRTEAAWFFRGRTFSRRILAAAKKLRSATEQLTPDAAYEDIVRIRAELRDAGSIVDECAAMLRGLAEMEGEEFWLSLTKWVRREKITPRNLKVAHGRLRGSDENWDYSFRLPEFDLAAHRVFAREVRASWPRV